MSDSNGLPTDWKRKKLGELVDKITSKALPADHPDAKFIGMDCIEPHTLRPAFLYDFKDFKSAGNLFEPNQVLYGRMRPYLNKVYKAQFSGSCSGEFIVLKCDDDFSPDLLQYILHSREFVRFVNEKTSGDRPRVTFEEISEYPIFLPPMEEQERIVAKIEELFSELDTGVEALKKAQKQLKTYRQSVLKHAFEGRLTNDQIDDGKLPEGWKRTTLGEISQSRLGKMLDKEKNQGTLQPYLRNINVRWNGFDFDDVLLMRFEANEGEKFGLLEGDLVVCEGGEPGRSAIWRDTGPKMKIQKALHRVRFENPATAPFVMHFLKYSADGKTLSRYFTGTTIKHLTGESLRQVKLPFPPIDEQQRIVAEIESRLSVCEKLEETIAASLKQSEALRQSILKKAFEGKLVPSVA